ncbi:MAG: hypothetical protein RBT01_05360 [Anaerolineaceae bacterium]|jgi:hypothetical protein|nr:hypothetical protein [Anaerolineaceae bacterium]
MTIEKTDIENIIRNTRKYWYVDGLSEIAGGLVIFLTGLTYWLIYGMADSSTKNFLLILAPPAVILLGASQVRKILPQLKEKLTYPRSGYLTFKKPNRTIRVKRAVFAGLLSAIISATAVMVLNGLPQRFIPLFSSFLLTLFSIYIGYQVAVPRFYLTGFLILMLGSIISWINPTGALPFMLLFSGMGIIWIISGLITLFLYLRNTQPMPEQP